MKAFKYLIVAGLFPALASAQVQGRETGNAGHPMAIAFQTRALEAIAHVRSHAERFPELAGVDLLKILSGAELIVVDKPIPVTKNGITQNVPLESSSNPNRVKIYGQGWSDIKDWRVEQKLALHELNILAGIEETGIYKIEAKYDKDNLEPIELRPVSAGGYWKFHKATPEDVAKFASYPPKTKEHYDSAPELQRVSQALYFPMYTADYQLMEMKFEVLEYESADEDSDEFYQLVVSDPRGNVVNSQHVFDDLDFRIFSTLNVAGPDVTIASFDVDQTRGNIAAMRLRSINGKSDYLSTYSGFEYKGVVDHVYLDQPYKVLMLGKPAAGRPYGLYVGMGSASVPKLIKALNDLIPGHEKNDDPSFTKSEVAKTILAVYQNMRGTFAIVNDLKGIMSVNIQTGESVYLYEVPEQGRFAAILKDGDSAQAKMCKDLVVGIYKTAQGEAFFSGLSHGYPDYLMFPGQEGDEPAFVLHLGVQAKSQSIALDLYGCRAPKAIDYSDDED